MKKYLFIFVLSLCSALVTDGAQRPAKTSSPELLNRSENHLLQAKAAYNLWLETGTATASDKMLVEEYLRMTSSVVDDNDHGGNPLAQQGGPDSSGYRYVDNQPPDSATFAWMELCGDPLAQNGPQGDDVLQPISWSWPFLFYGQNFNSASITTNGAIGFGANAPGFSNTCEPRATSAGRFIYVYWDDLNAATAGGCTHDGNPPWIRWRDFGDKVVIEWKQIRHFADDGLRVEAEAILYPDGKIKLQYNPTHTAFAQGATIGIERPGTSNGLGNGVQYSCNLPQSLAGRAIWFFNPPPTTPDLLVENLLPCGIVPSSPQPVSVRVRNAGVMIAPSTLVRYRFDGIDGPPQSVPPLEPASFFDVFLVPPINVTEGAHTLIAYVNNVDPSIGNDTARCSSLCGSPLNDACENALPLAPPLPGSPTSVTGSTSCASMTCSEGIANCDYASAGPDVFYSLTLNTCRRIDMNLTGGDMHLSVYAQGLCCIQPPLLCNDDRANFPQPPWGDPSHLPAGSLESYVAAELPAGTYAIRVGRYSSGSGPYTLNVFDNGPCPVPCAGTIGLSSNSMMFPATYVGQTSVQTVQVSNNGSSPLCVSDIVSPGDVWTVSPTSFTLNPGEGQPVTVAFSPTFDHRFYSELEIVSSDPVNPRTDIYLGGPGCDPFGRFPPRLAVSESGVPNAMYVQVEHASDGTEFAIEVSADNFSTSTFVDRLGALSPQPTYLTAQAWGEYSSGIMGGLGYLTEYEIRAVVRDCAGNGQPAPPLTFTTGEPIICDCRPQITIRLADPQTLELNWDPILRDNLGRPLQVDGFEIYHRPSLDVPIEFIALNLTGSHSFPLPPDPKGFYYVEPILSPVLLGPHPFIAWPPDSANLSGLNSVVIKDLYHLAEWDSFRVEMDTPNGTVLLGSSYNNPWSESDQRQVAADFSVYGSGWHTITVTVVPHSGNPITLVRRVNVIQPPHGEFTASYDPSTQNFSLSATNLQNISGPILGFVWQTTQHLEHYGPSIQLHWDPAANDSFTVVSVRPIIDYPYWTEEEPRYLLNTEAGGIVPETVTTTIPWFAIECCCDNLELRTTGTADGTYYDRAGNATEDYPLGAQVVCDPASNRAHVSFAFEVVLTLKYKFGEQWIFCSSGQDCKRTDTDQVGVCESDTFRATKDLPPDHKKYGGVDYPANGPNYGNDDYRPDRHGGTYDASELGKIRWIDAPVAEYTLKNNRAIRCRREAHFVARADPQCQPVNILCCRSWDLNWDVVFCQNCSQIIQNTPPDITNEQTPVDCPALAAN